MKQLFKHISIRKKLTLAIMSSSLLILLLVSGAYIVVEIHSSKTILVRETATLANSLGENSRQLLMLNQFRDAEKVLASLKLQPNIHAAYLFDENGKPVAEYLDQFDSRFLLQAIPIDFAQQNRSFWTDSKIQQISSDWRHLGLFVPIFHGQQRVGALYLLSDMHNLHGRINAVVFSVLLALALLAICSWWLSGQLQKPVSGPLLALVRTMEQISLRKNYGLRAVKHGRDEIGVLVDGFNHMLDQIERHRGELEAHQDSLEQAVLQRTADLNRTVDQLRVAKQQAEAASDAKSQFLANITHELRTPLNGVLGMNELLFRTALTEQQEMLATTVQRSGDDLLRLIDGVLDFSRIESGLLQLEIEEFAFYQVVEEVVGLLWQQADEKGLKIFTDIPLNTTWKVQGDKKRAKQIVMNLLGNAIKFTDSGEINIRLRLLQPAEQQAVFQLEVEDTGIGMDAETQERIFSAFYQADSSITREYGGAGLGLGIVRQLLDMMQGAITCESQPQQGSRFRANLPLPLVKRDQLIVPEPLKQRQILVQEDDPRSQQLLLHQLDELGLQVAATTSVADAWYQLRAAKRNAQPFPLMILSATATLPDGQSLLDAIREDDADGRLRRILLLPNNSDNVGQRGSEARLYRPLTWSKLLMALQKCWHELHLVSNPNLEETVANRTTDLRGNIPLALLGGSVASQELVRMALRSTSFAAHVVNTPEELVPPAEEHKYQAVILDLRSSEIDQWTRFLQQHSLSNLIIIHQPGDPVDPLRPFAEGLLEKPFDPITLQRTLDRLSQAAKLNSAGEEA